MQLVSLCLQYLKQLLKRHRVLESCDANKLDDAFEFACLQHVMGSGHERMVLRQVQDHASVHFVVAAPAVAAGHIPRSLMQQTHAGTLQLRLDHRLLTRSGS